MCAISNESHAFSPQYLPHRRNRRNRRNRTNRTDRQNKAYFIVFTLIVLRELRYQSYHPYSSYLSYASYLSYRSYASYLSYPSYPSYFSYPSYGRSDVQRSGTLEVWSAGKATSERRKKGNLGLRGRRGLMGLATWIYSVSNHAEKESGDLPGGVGRAWTNARMDRTITVAVPTHEEAK